MVSGRGSTDGNLDNSVAPNLIRLVIKNQINWCVIQFPNVRDILGV